MGYRRFAKFANLLRHYPLNTPRASILSRLPPIPEGAREFVGKHGLRYREYWRTEDHVSRCLYWFGDFDPWVNAALRRLARPGTIAVDIGANIGATALVLAQAVGSQGYVICFEPVSHNATMLKRNLSANNFSWAEVVERALSDRAGRVNMQVPAHQGGMSRVVKENSVDAIEVEALTFDGWRNGRDLNISVCKIDVESHEEEVFEGMAQSFECIDSFVFERHNAKSDDRVFSGLQSSGFEIFRIEKGFAKTYFRPYDGPTNARSTTDFVAVKPRALVLLK